MYVYTWAVCTVQFHLSSYVSTLCVIIESVDSIIKDERDLPLTQYITNRRISRAG